MTHPQPLDAPRPLGAALEHFAGQLGVHLSNDLFAAQTAAHLTGAGVSYQTLLLSVVHWTNDLAEVVPSRTRRPPPGAVLCAFGSVYDRTCYLDGGPDGQLRKLLDWIEQESQDFLADPISDQPLDRILHPQDIRTALCAVLPTEGGKTVVDNHRLRQRLIESKFAGEKGAVGGAAAIISGTLNRLGVTSCFYSPYHSAAIAELFCEEARWLDLNAAQPLEPRPAVRGEAGHPTRYGFALAYHQSVYTDLPGCAAPTKPPRTDRHLLVLRQPMGPRTWESWFVGESAGDGAFADGEWPMPAGFVRWEIQDHALHFAEAPADWLAELGRRHAYVVVTSPQPKEIKGGRAPEIFWGQYTALQKAGATLHLELSSAAGPRDDLPGFAEFSRSCLDSVGVNADELPSYAALVDPRQWPMPPKKAPAPPPDIRFEQARALAAYLGVARLYVHGNDIDLILRRGAGHAVLEAERQADLFAKGAVFVATTLRNGYTLDEVRLPLAFPSDAVERLAELQAYLSGRPGALAGSGGIGAQAEATGPEDYGVVAVPCIWYVPDATPWPFSSTGAGDITSGVSLAYSGWRARLHRGA